MKTIIKKQLAQELLSLANSYEPKQRKQLRGIKYLSDCAKWIGHAHDYTVHVSQLNN